MIGAVIVFALGASSASAGSGWSKHQAGVRRGDATPPAKDEMADRRKTVSGRVKGRVALGGARPMRVDFAVDSVKTGLTRHRVGRRGTATLDTTKLSNGFHTLTAVAYGARRPRRWRVTVTVADVIGEIRSSEHGGSEAAWIEDMLARLPSYPKMRGLLWFEKFDDNMDWPLETSDDAVSAFASGIQSSACTASDYGNASTSPIPHPGP